MANQFRHLRWMQDIVGLERLAAKVSGLGVNTSSAPLAFPECPDVAKQAILYLLPAEFTSVSTRIPGKHPGHHQPGAAQGTFAAWSPTALAKEASLLYAPRPHDPGAAPVLDLLPHRLGR